MTTSVLAASGGVKQVICINWGTKYGAPFINRLYAMVARNITPPFTFTCFTDNRAGLNSAILCEDLPPLEVERMIALIVVAMDATHIRAKWLALFTALLPLYLALKIDAAGLDPARRLPALLSIAGVLSVGVIVMLWARVFVGPIIGDYSFAHTPFHGFAQVVRADPGPPPVAIVLDDRIVAGNLRIQFPDTPVILTGFSQEAERRLPAGRILAAWSAEGKGREEVPPRISALLQLMAAVDCRQTSTTWKSQYRAA